jgi:hypothetical protein
VFLIWEPNWRVPGYGGRSANSPRFRANLGSIMRPRIRPHVAVDASQCLGTRSLPQHSPRQTRPRVQTKRTRPDSSHGKAVRLKKSNGFFAFHAPLGSTVDRRQVGPSSATHPTKHWPHSEHPPTNRSAADPIPPAGPKQARTNHGNLMPIPSRHLLHVRFEVVAQVQLRIQHEAKTLVGDFNPKDKT